MQVRTREDGMAPQQADIVSCGDLLRQARKSQRLSQLDLALKVGASQGLSEQDGTVNILEAVLHPEGLRQAIENFDEVAAHLYHQTRTEAAHSPALSELLGRLAPLWPASVTGSHGHRGSSSPPPSPVLSTRLRTPVGALSFFSAFTTFGTPLDITVASLRVEHQFAADEATERTMRSLVAGAGTPP